MFKWYRNLKILHKTIVLSIFVFLSMMGAFLFVFVHQTKSNFGILLEGEMKQNLNMLEEHILSFERDALMFSSALAQVDVVKQAYYLDPKDVNAYMMKNVEPLIKRIRKDSGLSSDRALTVHLHRKNSVSLWREWNGKGGDSLKRFRFTVNEVQRSRQALMSVEEGHFGLALRGIVPVFDEKGKLLGSLESFGSLVPILERLINNKSDEAWGGLLVKKGVLIAKIGDWFDANEFFRNPEIKKLLDASRKGVFQYRNWMLGYFPVKDFKGEEVAGVILIEDISSVLKRQNSLISMNLIFGFALSLVMIVGVSLLIYFMLTKVLEKIKRKTDHIISGTEKADLTKTIEYKTKDEIGMVVSGFNRLLEKINDDLWTVKDAALSIQRFSKRFEDLMKVGVRSNLEEIKAGIEKIDHYTEEQTAGVEEVNSTIEEMSRNIDSINGNVERQAAGMEESASSIEEMNRNIEQTVLISRKTMDISHNLNDVAQEGGNAVRQSIQSIREVSDFSQQILKMLKLITDISKQTNLLAMNASIEAAHAGDAGKGFAIVADEIRRLSENTNKGAKDIGDVVNSIVEKIEESVGLAEKAGTGLEMIEAYSKQNVSVISQLNISMEEQDKAAKEILNSIQEMVRITEEIALSMKEQKTGMQEFTLTMQDLRKMSLDTKAVIKSHIDSLFALIKVIEEIESGSSENSKRVGVLIDLVDRFILKKPEKKAEIAKEETSLKLVE